MKCLCGLLYRTMSLIPSEDVNNHTNVYDVINPDLPASSRVATTERSTVQRLITNVNAISKNLIRGIRPPTSFSGGRAKSLLGRRNRTLRHRSRMSQEYTFNINSKGSNPLNVNLNL
jgi:hypothetical protein